MKVNRIDIRASISQAKFNEEAMNTLGVEITIASIALGILTKSWWVFGIVFLGSAIGLRFKQFTLALCLIFSLCWGIIGYFIGTLFSSVSASIVLAIIGLVSGFCANSAAVDWIRDMGNRS